MPFKFIVAIDHIYEGPITFWAFITQNGGYNHAKCLLSTLGDNFIADVSQYCAGNSSSHTLFGSMASEWAGVFLYKIYFPMSTNNYIKQLQKYVGTTRLVKMLQKIQLFLVLGNYSMITQISEFISIVYTHSTVTDDCQRWSSWTHKNQQSMLEDFLLVEIIWPCPLSNYVAKVLLQESKDKHLFHHLQTTVFLFFNIYNLPKRTSKNALNF